MAFSGSQRGNFHEFTIRNTCSPLFIEQILPQSEFETAISNTYANSPFQALVVIEGKSIEFPEFSDPRWREVTMNVTRNYTNVRRLPTTNSASIGTIYRGTAAKVLVEETVKRFDGSWLPIRVDLGYSTPGWVRSDVVNYKPVVDEPTATISWHRATVSSRGNRTNVREGPSVQNARVGQVFRNTPAEIAPEAGVQRPDGLWLPIHIGDNFEIEGWVRDDVVNYHLV
jgi:hypothetical protein